MIARTAAASARRRAMPAGVRFFGQPEQANRSTAASIPISRLHTKRTALYGARSSLSASHVRRTGGAATEFSGVAIAGYICAGRGRGSIHGAGGACGDGGRGVAELD